MGFWSFWTRQKVVHVWGYARFIYARLPGRSPDGPGRARTSPCVHTFRTISGHFPGRCPDVPGRFRTLPSCARIFSDCPSCTLPGRFPDDENLKKTWPLPGQRPDASPDNARTTPGRCPDNARTSPDSPPDELPGQRPDKTNLKKPWQFEANEHICCGRLLPPEFLELN